MAQNKCMVLLEIIMLMFIMLKYHYLCVDSAEAAARTVTAIFLGVQIRVVC